MKTLIINGSPRKNGGTATLVSELQKHLNGEIIVINTYYTSISPCIDCRHCWTHPNCAINDEMQNVYELINDVDNIVIASPIYFAELTGSLLQFASRLQYIWVSKTFRHEPVLSEKTRYGAVILVDGGDGYMDTAMAMAKRLIRNMGGEFKDFVYSSGTNTIPVEEDANAMEGISRLAKVLNRDI